MADYTQNTNFAAKDALITGDPEKIILGADLDGEFSELATSSASKEDSTNKGAISGYCPLDSSSLVPVAYLPVATDAAIGCFELATAAEADALTAPDKYITPLLLDGVFKQNDGVLSDLQALTGEGTDVLYGYDFSTTTSIAFDVTEGIQLLLTDLKLDIFGLGSETPVAADEIVFYDDTDSTHKKVTVAAVEAILDPVNMVGYDANVYIDHTAVTITAGDALAYSTGGTDISASATIDLDTTNLSAVSGSALLADDEFIFWDAAGAAHKKIIYKSAGIPVVNKTASFSLDDDDMNTYFTCDHASTPIVVTLNTGVGEKGNVIIIQQSGAALVSVAGTSTVNSALGLKCNLEDSVITLVCTATDVWSLYGDHKA